MKAVKRINYHGRPATLFANGDVIWADQLFPQGLGANAGLLTALAI